MFQLLDWISRDVRHAFRGIRRKPAFAVTAVLSLALGIGANTAIFSFVNAILLKRLPVPEPDRLVTFAETNRGETSGKVWRLSTVEQLAKRDPDFSGLFGWFGKPVSFSTGDQAQWVMGELVTGQYFQALQVKPLMGRLLTGDDVRNAKASPVCVLSFALWQREFAGDPGVIGGSVFLNGHAYRVLGITPRGFYGAALERRFDLQIPATRIGDIMPAFADATSVDWLKTLSWLTPMARLKPGITRIEAQEQTQRVLRQIDIENNGGHNPEKQSDLRLEDGSQGFNDMRSAFGRPLLVLMAVVALVLLIMCANLANLLLARAQARAKEFAVRMSIGASRIAIIRQLFMESLVLAACGGAFGTALSLWISSTLVAFLNAGRSPVSALQVRPDLNVLAFSITLSFATAILFGLVPASQATRPSLLPGLKQERPGGPQWSRSLFRGTLLVVQIALSLVVVFAAGLLTRTLRSLETIDLGFKPDQVIALRVDPAAAGHSSADVSRILEDILTRARVLPGVRAASLAASTPNGSMAISMTIDVPGYTPKRGEDNIADFNFISSDYFHTLDQPFLRGRDFRDADDQNAPRVAIVNEKFVRDYFAGQDPLGRKFRQGGSDLEIIGVVANARDRGIRNGPEDAVYLPEKQAQTSGLTVLVRSQYQPAAILPSLLAIVKSIDRRTPVLSAQTLATEVEAGLSTERILGYLSTLFAILATLLAGIGLYGVLAYSVVRRTREIGVRFAVGAQRRHVAALFAAESGLWLLVGLSIGGALALACARAFEGLLFGVAGTDPVTLSLSILLLAIAACLGMAMPLWRATRVDPIVALRAE